MALFTTSLNPVGNPSDVLNSKVEEFKKAWDAVSPKETWWKSKTAQMIQAISFLFNSVDAFILELNKHRGITVGADKKATVLMAIGVLYDYTVRALLPIYLRPFARRVKSLVIDVLISYAIDFIVEKYNNGLWRDDEVAKPEEEPKVEPENNQASEPTLPPSTI